MFGSVARGEYRPESDLDLLYVLKPAARLGFSIFDPGIAWRAATRLRNRIVHGHWDIDTETLVTTAGDDLPQMITGLQVVITVANIDMPDSCTSGQAALAAHSLVTALPQVRRHEVGDLDLDGQRRWAVVRDGGESAESLAVLLDPHQSMD